VLLSLQIISPASANVSSSRHAFDETGGSIGRESDNAWVLPHSKVSGHHAVITYRDPDFYIEDTSRNGVFLNSSKNRLPRGQPQPLKSGDRLLIEPYEIRVSITHDRADHAPASVAPMAGRPPALHGRDADPFGDDDPFAAAPPLGAPAERPSPDAMSRQELDPLELLNLGSTQPPPRKAPTAKDLDLGSPLEGHFQPPAAVSQQAPPRPADALTIPEDYDPLAPDDPAPRQPSPRAPRVERVPPEPEPEPDPSPPSPVVLRPVPAARREAPTTPPPRPEPAAAAVPPLPTADLGAVLEGAGLDPADVTPELARTFGEILRVVVSGVMDVMRSRQQIKDEFRMRMTRFRTAENNPLKFSANVDDALHNLLVKRNPAYLPPVDAFEDAFTDLRHHQLAMLAGLRTAFESMLAEFDPDRLQQEFDRHLSKGLVPAKLRYWEMFREKRQEIDKDPEASFRRLFGEAFARAYEEQLNQLKTHSNE
jgi:type VI secretion system FHA domain protein